MPRNIRYTTAYYVDNKKDTTKLECLKSLIIAYTNCGFKVEGLLANFEFECIRNRVDVLDIKLNITSTSEHVGDIERFVSIINERV